VVKFRQVVLNKCNKYRLVLKFTIFDKHLTVSQKRYKTCMVHLVTIDH